MEAGQQDLQHGPIPDPKRIREPQSTPLPNPQHVQAGHRLPVPAQGSRILTRPRSLSFCIPTRAGSLLGTASLTPRPASALSRWSEDEGRLRGVRIARLLFSMRLRASSLEKLMPIKSVGILEHTIWTWPARTTGPRPQSSPNQGRSTPPHSQNCAPPSAFHSRKSRISHIPLESCQ
jgi:hypothetical protein